MMRKPTTAAGYDPLMAEEARRMCLYVATILGDLISEVVVVGGLELRSPRKAELNRATR